MKGVKTVQKSLDSEKWVLNKYLFESVNHLSDRQAKT